MSTRTATELLTDHETVYVDGEWAKAHATGTIDVVSPWSETVIATVPDGSRDDIDSAVAAAERALGLWSATPLAERVAVIERFRDLLVQRSEPLAQLITEEMGCPITQSRTIQVVNPVGILEAYVETALSFPFRHIRRSANGQSLVLRDPVGVVAGIVPWNVPASLMVQKVVPALLTGCTVVLKPAPETPLDAYFLADLFHEAGLPPGVLNVVPADREVSEYLVSHPGVSKVTFTGSSAAGRRIASICGNDLRRATLELGGKSAAVLLPDADLDLAVEALRLGAFRNNGQICTLKTRVLVPRTQQAELEDRLVGLVESMPVGDPHEDTTHIGPLVTARQRGRVEDYIAQGRASGARLVVGGARPSTLHHGWFVEPTVFSDVDPASTIAQEEIFGPVLVVLPYDTEDEAVAVANSTIYGLNGSMFTTDAEHGLRVAQRMHTGTVELNGNGAGSSAPMGGVKASGIGREFGPEGLEPFVETKAIGVPAHLAAELERQG